MINGIKLYQPSSCIILMWKVTKENIYNKKYQFFFLEYIFSYNFLVKKVEKKTQPLTPKIYCVQFFS